MHTDFGTTSTTDEIVRYWKEKAKNTGIGEISNIEIPYFTLFDVEDNYQDYDKPSIKIMTSVCDFKCCKEQGLDVSVCANHKYSSELPKKVPNESILGLFNHNRTICSSIVFGGLEPLKQMSELYYLCKYLRDNGVDEDIVIYTGYYPEELNPHDMLLIISLGSIIIKFGRYIPNSKPVFDKVLGVELISDNQFAVKF